MYPNEHGGRRPVATLETVTRGEMLTDNIEAQRRIDENDPEQSWGLGLAQVTMVDYEDHLLTLRVVVGASSSMERAPINIPYPGAGARRFLGSVPEIGDIAVVGWAAQDSKNKTPVILGWMIKGVWTGREWVTTSNFTVDEADQGTQRERDAGEGVLPRTRHKLRHMYPGNVVASSSQGADMVLDEGVTLANRRGNEFRLRDQDQAAVLRALQKFEALSGVRTYEGMVQRDALFLPDTVVSDGFIWDDKRQTVDGRPLSDGELIPDVNAGEGSFLSAPPYARELGDDNLLGEPLFKLDTNVDPYSFLQNGGLLSDRGTVLGYNDVLADAQYGGKPLYRVSMPKGDNAVLQPNTRALVEHRIEVTHTSDGRLPVTEQTDMFDAERLPGGDPTVENDSPNAPFIQMVYGSVVGNDPYSQIGRREYGVPLMANIFDGDAVEARVEAVTLASTTGGPVPTPIEDHAATLFKLNPLTGDFPTFWSVNKKGQVKMFLSGPTSQNSAEVALQGGLKLSVGGRFKFMTEGGLDLGTNSRNSLHVRSDKGPVTIFGGGSLTGAEAVLERLAGTGGGEGDLPSVDIQGRTNVRVRATKKVFIKGAAVSMEGTLANIQGHDQVSIQTAKGFDVSAETINMVSTAKRVDEFSGPKNSLPTNGPLHERNYTPTIPGQTAERVIYNSGNREETFKQGNHTTTVQVGDATYEVQLGKLILKGGNVATIELSSDGISGTAQVGNVSLTASAGQASLSGATSATLRATGGTATVRGSAGVNLAAPVSGPDSGPIICAGSIDPLTGKPFSTWGMGAKNHTVIP